MNEEERAALSKAELEEKVEQLRASLREAAKVEEKQKPEKKKKHTGLITFLVILAVLAVLALLLTQVLFGIARVSDEGMDGTVNKGDFVIFSRLDKDPELGNIIVIKDENGDKRVRYVAALDGDVVDFDRYDRRLFINAKIAVDDYVKTSDDKLKYPYAVGGSELYVLCKNRNNAKHEGVFPRKSVQGKVILTL